MTKAFGAVRCEVQSAKVNKHAWFLRLLFHAHGHSMHISSYFMHNFLIIKATCTMRYILISKRMGRSQVVCAVGRLSFKSHSAEMSHLVTADSSWWRCSHGAGQRRSERRMLEVLPVTQGEHPHARTHTRTFFHSINQVGLHKRHIICSMWREHPR